MSRNGTDFGIRVSGTGDDWFTAPVELPDGLYFPGYTEEDANLDMGDSTIVETIGLGGFAMAASPAVAGFVGAGSAADAANYTRTMYETTAGRNPDWTLPSLDFAGTPTGIDIQQGAGDRHRSHHQHRHRPPRARHRPSRGRHRQGAHGLF